MRYLFLVLFKFLLHQCSVLEIGPLWPELAYATDYICAPLDNSTSVTLGGSDTMRVLEVSARRSDR